MRKSTSMSQLPNRDAAPDGFFPGASPEGGFINDTQRDMVTNAQQAAQSFTIPTNTSLMGDAERAGMMGTEITEADQVANMYNAGVAPPPIPIGGAASSTRPMGKSAHPSRKLSRPIVNDPHGIQPPDTDHLVYDDEIGPESYPLNEEEYQEEAEDTADFGETDEEVRLDDHDGHENEKPRGGGAHGGNHRRISKTKGRGMDDGFRKNWLSNFDGGDIVSPPRVSWGDYLSIIAIGSIAFVVFSLLPLDAVIRHYAPRFVDSIPIVPILGKAFLSGVIVAVMQKYVVFSSLDPAIKNYEARSRSLDIRNEIQMPSTTSAEEEEMGDNLTGDSDGSYYD